MIDIKEYKKSLGTLAVALSEEEIIKMRDRQDEAAELYWTLWRSQEPIIKSPYYV